MQPLFDHPADLAGPGLGAPRVAPVVILAQDGNYLMRLASRSDYPRSVVVEVAQDVWPFFNCGLFEVVAYDERGDVIDRRPVAPGKWTRPLANVVSGYDCWGSAALLLGGHLGRVRFALLDEDAVPVLQSPYLVLGALPDGSATDEQPTLIDGVAGLGSGTASLLRWAALGAVALGAVVYAPQVKAFIDR